MTKSTDAQNNYLHQSDQHGAWGYCSEFEATHIARCLRCRMAFLLLPGRWYHVLLVPCLIVISK